MKLAYSYYACVVSKILLTLYSFIKVTLSGDILTHYVPFLEIRIMTPLTQFMGQVSYEIFATFQKYIYIVIDYHNFIYLDILKIHLKLQKEKSRLYFRIFYMEKRTKKSIGMSIC